LYRTWLLEAVTPSECRDAVARRLMHVAGMDDAGIEGRKGDERPDPDAVGVVARPEQGVRVADRVLDVGGFSQPGFFGSGFVDRILHDPRLLGHFRVRGTHARRVADIRRLLGHGRDRRDETGQDRDDNSGATRHRFEVPRTK
jgi:hypothetical protein